MKLDPVTTYRHVILANEKKRFQNLLALEPKPFIPRTSQHVLTLGRDTQEVTTYQEQVIAEHREVYSPKVRFKFGNVALVLCAVMLGVVGLTGAGGTHSFFSDIERTDDNGFAAAILDLTASSSEPAVLAISEGNEQFLNTMIAPHEESMMLLFNGHAEWRSGSSTLCDLLYLRARKDGEQLYWGLLLDFTVIDIADPGEWEFEVKFPEHDEGHIPTGTQCNVDLVFEGYDADASWMGESGYTDTEIIPLRLVKSSFNCLGPNCDDILDDILGTTTDETATSTDDDMGTSTDETATSTDPVDDDETSTSTPPVDDEQDDETGTTTPPVEEEDEDEEESEEEDEDTEDEEEENEDEEQTREEERDERRERRDRDSRDDRDDDDDQDDEEDEDDDRRNERDERRGSR